MIRRVSIPVEDRVFLVDDIMRLAELLYSEFSATRSHSKRVSFTLLLSDNSSYEVQDEDPAELQQVLTTRKVSRIDFNLYDFEKETQIKIQLAEGYPWGNEINISAKGSSAFNRIKSQVDDSLATVKPQENPYLQHRALLKHIARLYFGALTLELVFILVNHLGVKPSQHPSHSLIVIADFLHTYRVPILLIFTYVEGLYPQDLLFRYLDKLWPTVEFDFGPDHLRTSKVKRQYVGYVMTAIIIPIFLQLLFLRIHL